jgi:hypothetical protein
MINTEEDWKLDKVEINSPQKSTSSKRKTNGRGILITWNQRNIMLR